MGECESHSALIKLFEGSMQSMKETVEVQLSSLGHSIDMLRDETKENGHKLDEALASISVTVAEQATMREQIKALCKTQEKQERKVASLQRVTFMGLGAVAAVSFIARFIKF